MNLTTRTKLRYWSSTEPASVGYGRNETSEQYWERVMSARKPDCVGSPRIIQIAYREDMRDYGSGTLWSYRITDTLGNKVSYDDIVETLSEARYKKQIGG